MKPEIKSDRYFTCLNGCSHKFYIEHCFKDNFKNIGPWYCDYCGQGHLIKIENNEVNVEKYIPKYNKDHDGIRRKQWVYLEIPPLKESIFLKVKSTRFKQNIDEEEKDWCRFHFEENTSICNIFNGVVEVRYGEDDGDLGINVKFLNVVDAVKNKDK